MIAVLGQKRAMTQIYDEKRTVIPVTPIDVSDCVVVGLRTREKHGYVALQIGAGKPTKRQLTKPVEGHCRKAGVAPVRWLCEVKSDGDFQVGQKLGVELFQVGDKVSVTGITRGRGFSGGMRRWGWHGGPATHGSMSHRRIGSVSSGSSPGRVWPGRTLPGHYGCEQVTVRNLRVVRIDADKAIMYVRGAVPGHKGGRLLIKKA